MDIKISIWIYYGHNNDADFKHPSNTHYLKSNIKKRSFMAMISEFNGH